jgi:hypothetical protein
MWRNVSWNIPSVCIAYLFKIVCRQQFQGTPGEITACALQHSDNLCTEPVPALVHQCLLWETCMKCDPLIVSRARVAAELIAEVVNQLVESISLKTLVRVRIHDIT